MKHKSDFLQGLDRRTLAVTSVLFISLVILGTLLAGCTQTQNPAPTPNKTVLIVDSQGVGPMPPLLATKQVDGYIAWQPYVEVAPESGIGKVVTYSQDLPPDSVWKNHPTNALVAREDLVQSNPALVGDLSALAILGTKYINDNPQKSADLTADWLAGKGNFSYGNISVSSVTVLTNAMPHIKYTNDPSDSWLNSNNRFIQSEIDLGYISGYLKNTTGADRSARLYNFTPYGNANTMISNRSFAIPAPDNNKIGLGYLLAADHAALFVVVKDWQYFNDTYGITLKPEDLTASRPDKVDLLVNGTKVAEITLVSAAAGPQLMQLAATNGIQASFVGVPPALASIDKGNPIVILMPIDNEGSGLVVRSDAPVQDWKSFTDWAAQQSALGKPVKIAVPSKGSIQDIMLRYALEDSGFNVTG